MMRLPRGQRLMPPVVIYPTQDGYLLMAYPLDRLQNKIKDLKALYQSSVHHVSQND